MLGRDESRHISCKYEGRESECPKSCDKCAISIKTEGDFALTQNELDKAIKQYKRAVFVEPKFAEAWVNMGNAYGMKSEYNHARSAFNKAIAIDPTYGKALLGKAITLKNLAKFEEAMLICNEILEMYDDKTKKSLNELVNGEDFIKIVKDLNAKLEIPTNIKEIEIEDLPFLIKHIQNETWPLYPVPNYLTNDRIEEMLLKIKG